MDGKTKTSSVNTLEKPNLDTSEMSKLKMEEEELMKEAMYKSVLLYLLLRGLAPKRRRDSGRALQKHELKELLKKGNTERDEFDVSRKGGLGFEP